MYQMMPLALFSTTTNLHYLILHGKPTSFQTHKLTQLALPPNTMLGVKIRCRPRTTCTPLSMDFRCEAMVSLSPGFLLLSTILASILTMAIHFPHLPMIRPCLMATRPYSIVQAMEYRDLKNMRDRMCKDKLFLPKLYRAIQMPMVNCQSKEKQT